jgi:hypothetical protein
MLVYFEKDIAHEFRWVMTIDSSSIRWIANDRTLAMFGDKERAIEIIKNLKNYGIEAKMGRQPFKTHVYHIYTTFKTKADEAFFVMKVSEGIEI